MSRLISMACKLHLRLQFIRSLLPFSPPRLSTFCDFDEILYVWPLFSANWREPGFHKIGQGSLDSVLPNAVA